MNKRYNFSNLLFFLLPVTFLCILMSCDKNDADVVPDTFVDITINTINYSIGVTQSVVFTNTMAGTPSLGYDNNGIIIFRNGDDEFYAFDRTCTYHVEESISINPNGFMATCPECKSTYNLAFNGNPSDKGPSIYPLKQYHADFNPNTQDLHIYNF